MTPAAKPKQEYDIIHLTLKCNLKCVFCSNDRQRSLELDRYNRCLEKIRKNPPEKVTIEGGEPTLEKRLPAFLEKLKGLGAREIILTTNGVLFSNKDFARSMLKTGIDLFNINFSSCRASTSEALTGDKKALQRKLKGINNLIKLGAQDKLRLTFVINTLNYKELPHYIEFVHREFPGIFYAAFNMIKVMGAVKKRTYLVPRLTDIKPHLLKALRLSKKYGIKVITDGIPLCFMPGFCDAAIDTHKKLVLGHENIHQKYMPASCAACGSRAKCGGLRKDYAELYGERELNASKP